MGYNLPINGVYWGHNPLTNLLPTSWDFQVPFPWIQIRCLIQIPSFPSSILEPAGPVVQAVPPRTVTLVLQKNHLEAMRQKGPWLFS